MIQYNTMKVLMFGWEFPPFISGGLGTACYGIAKSLSEKSVNVVFVLPTKKSDSRTFISSNLTVLGADEIPLYNYNEMVAKLTLLGIPLKEGISPYYTSPEFLSASRKADRLLSALPGGLLSFSGNYGKNLMAEVIAFSIAAESLCLLENFDVIHVHDWLTMLAGVRAKEISKKPLVVHVHATEFDRSGENVNQVVYNIERYGLERADRIIAVSYYTKMIICEKYGIAPEKISVVHNAVSKHKQFERYHIQKNISEKIVLFLGRITMQKGPDYFLEAANLVLQKIPDVRFVMAGSGDMLPRMITRMAELRLTDRFHFTGFLRGPDVERMYAQSDVYVMPSVSEPFGLTAFEALVYDVPVIISRQSGAREILSSAVTVDFWDIQKLAANIIAILDNPEYARYIVERCRGELQSIEWKNAAERIIIVYNSVI